MWRNVSTWQILLHISPHVMIFLFIYYVETFFQLTICHVVKLLHMTIGHMEKFLHMTDFSQQAPLVMLVTNIRYVWAGGGGNVFVCIRALVCVGVLTCVSALDCVGALAGVSTFVCVCALANVRMSDGVWCAEHKQTSLFQEKGYRYVLTSLSVGKIWWG